MVNDLFNELSAAAKAGDVYRWRSADQIGTEQPDRTTGPYFADSAPDHDVLPHA